MYNSDRLLTYRQAPTHPYHLFLTLQIIRPLPNLSHIPDAQHLLPSQAIRFDEFL
jgi:hypothetical protein